MTFVNVKPSEEFQFLNGQGHVLLIACGALAREIVDLIETNRWKAFDVACLPAKWHNTPQFIVPAIRDKIREGQDEDMPAIINASVHEGMRSATYSLADLVKKEWVSLQTAMSYAPNQQALDSAIKGLEVKAQTLVHRIRTAKG